jgi:hypothetical protein
MIDITRIRESYANMLDNQLGNIAVQDGHLLSPEAFQVLKDEFIKRALDTSPVEAAERKKLEIHQDKIRQIKESAADEYSKLIWKYILEEKEKETTDKVIIEGLVERGLDEPEANEMLATTQEKLKQVIDSSDTKMLVGGFSFVAGIFVTLATYSNAKMNGGIYIVAWGAILFGFISFFKQLSEKKRYKNLLAKL